MIINLKIEATIPPMKGHSIISSPAIKKNVSIIVLLEDYVIPLVPGIADLVIILHDCVNHVKVGSTSLVSV